MTKPETTRVTVTLPADLAERLRVAAEERVVGPGILVAYALETYLPELIPVDELRKRPR